MQTLSSLVGCLMLSSFSATCRRLGQIAGILAALARERLANVASKLRPMSSPIVQEDDAACQVILKASLRFPIRVIDVEETVGSTHGNIVFRKPAGWEFHTISHTWSKGVQSWSDIIAKKMSMLSMSNETAEGCYNDLFRREDFSGHECYAPFIEFLSLLKADGVKQVWLDALCINQGSESGEKSIELQNMGSYYAKSLGCYVCAHGFGEGFETWKEKGDELIMPRWFHRVWTFQEMLLPKTVVFILEIHPIIRRTINWIISKHREQTGVNGPCLCAMSMSGYPPPRFFISEEQEGEYSTSEEEDEIKAIKRRGNIEIMCGGFPCSQCGGDALIRRAKDLQLLEALQYSQIRQGRPGTDALPDVHFIDRQCISRLMVMAKEQLQKIVWKNCDEGAEWKLLRLEEVMQQRHELEDKMRRSMRGLHEYGSEEFIDASAAAAGIWDPIQVVMEVSKRDCTCDEDRILAILGVLGVEGAVQLRVGKSLDEQMLQLAQQLTRTKPTVTVLVKLCMAQYAGHTAAGMSWAPSMGSKGGLRPTGEEAPAPSWKELQSDRHVYARYMEVEEAVESGLLQLARVMRYFERDVQVRRVLHDGSLVCQARVLWDCSFEKQEDKTLFTLHLRSTGATPPHDKARLELQFPFKAHLSASSCLLHHRVFVAGHSTTLANQSMVRLQGPQLHSQLHSFQVCLVFLGRLNLPSEEKQEIMMVCVGSKNDGLLHKVGLAWLPGLEDMLSDHSSSMCTIGGFPDYMDRFVFKKPELIEIKRPL